MPARWLIWLLRLLVLGVVLDLAVSAVLGYFVERVDQDRATQAQLVQVSHCWDDVLAGAVARQPMARLTLAARSCIDLQIRYHLK